MPAPIRTELTLPADVRLLRLVQEYVLALGEMAGLPPDQAQSLAQGVWQACNNCLDCAADEDDPADYTLIGELTPYALTISVCDRGLPIDPALDVDAPSPDPEAPAPACLRGQGLSLIQQCADEVRWLNHGPGGKELRFTKYRTGSCRLEPPPAAAAGPPHQAAAPTAGQDCTIRLLRPEDAVRVAQLMYRVYGYSYSNEDFYYPERLEHDLATGRHVGVVAVAASGEIAGHVGVERPGLGPLAELGQLAVAPAYRGLGLKRRMGDRLQEEIRGLGLSGLFGEAVTLHPISQEGSESRGLHVSAIKLLDWQARFKKMESLHPGLPQAGETAGPQRETMVFYFKYLAPPGQAAICAPSRHREMLAKIYGNLGAPRQFLEPSGPPGLGKLAVHYDQALRVGTIQVDLIGIDTLPEIYQARRDLCDLAGAAVVGLDLPLAQGATPFLCEAAEAAGFFFSGVRPLFAADGDFLRLQYLNAPLDLERISLYSPFARELLDYILRERERVRQIQ